MHVPPSSVAAAIKKFMATDYFTNQIAPATRLSWSRYLIMAEHPDVLGALDVNEVRAKHVQQFLDCLASKPSSQRNARAAVAKMLVQK